jgi:Cd2+/Zn2+-exporting ATPase
MLGRFANIQRYRSVLRSIDFCRIFAAGLMIGTGFILGQISRSDLWWLDLFPLTALVLTGGPIVWGALQGLVRCRINVDELVSIAIVATLVLGEYTTAAIVAFIMAAGALIEEFTAFRARKSIEAIIHDQPETASLVSGNEELEVAVEQVNVGDVIRVRPGDVVPLDGEIRAGETSVDESSMTGEAMPQIKTPGDSVNAGTVNIDGCVDIRVTCPFEDSTQTRIIQLIRDAERHRAPVVRVVERYAKWFTPVILCLAGLTWGITGDIYRAVTVLIVGCPCAFVLATPTAVLAALGRASREGILIKGGKYLEAAREIDIVAFDKTGTLTEGKPVVAAIWTVNGSSPEKVLGTAALAETGSEHPFGRAIVEAAAQRGLHLENRGINTSSVRGLGVKAGTILVGNIAFLEREGVDIGPDCHEFTSTVLKEGRTALLVADQETVIGGLAMEDKVRDEARDIVAWVNESGMKSVVLTGDQEPPARAVAEVVGAGEIRACLMPGDKQSYLRNIQSDGHKVAYLGDGTNDGPALAEAHIGISLASRRNNVALETADAVLMSGGISRLPFLLKLGTATAITINQNLLLFGLTFNAAMLTLSASGILTPIMGAFAHNVGSVLVVLNSARLLRMRI